MTEGSGSEQSGAGAARDRIVEAARIAFGTNGFHATTTRHIAALAGMSPAAVYVHHQSKEALLFQLSLTGHQQTLAEVRGAIAAYREPEDRLRAFVTAFSRRQAIHHTTARIVNYELDALSPEHLLTIRALRRQIQQELQQILLEGTASGAFTCPAPSMTATAMIGMSIDVARWFTDDGAWSPDDVGERYGELAVRMVTQRD